MEVIIAALIAGAVAAAKDTAGDAVKDSYAGLKVLIKKKFADKNKEDDSDIVDKLEKKPDSEGVKGLLKEELAEIEVDKDEEITKRAAEILEMIQEKDPEGLKAGKYNIKVQGDIKGIVGDISGGTINQTIS